MFTRLIATTVFLFLCLTIFTVGQDDNRSTFLAYLEKVFDYLNHAEQGKNSCQTPKQASRLANFYVSKIIYDIPRCQDKKILAIAHKILADSFYSGDGIDQLPLMALHHYRQSARLGYPPGQFNAAIVYHEIGDIKKALYWMRQYQKNKNAPLRDHAKKMVNAWQKQNTANVSG